jgi:hypothetical protein
MFHRLIAIRRTELSRKSRRLYSRFTTCQTFPKELLARTHG